VKTRFFHQKTKQMATAKIVTWSRPDKEGQYPIGFKIYKNGKPSYIFEGHTLPDRKLWDAKKQEVKKSHPNAARLTNLLTKRLAELRNKALQLETDQNQVKAAEIKEAYKQIYNPTPNAKLLFKTFAKSYLEEKRSLGKYEVYHTDTLYITRLLDYTGNENLTFPEITVEFLRGWIVYLKQIKKVFKDETKPVEYISERTITNHLIGIRTIFNRAITDKVVSADFYPFSGKGKISIKLQGAAKIGPEEWEIKRIEELDLSEHSSIMQVARNIWLTEFYFAGMRITDCLLLKWTDFQNGRLYYQMSKNGEHGSVKIPEKAKAIIEQYRRSCGDKASCLAVKTVRNWLPRDAWMRRLAQALFLWNASNAFKHHLAVRFHSMRKRRYWRRNFSVSILIKRRYRLRPSVCTWPCWKPKILTLSETKFNMHIPFCQV
jgi:site-specific recombinase XerD